VLSEKYSLFDIEDVEAWCGSFLERANLELGWADREDLHTYLIEETWILSKQYRAGTAGFSTWAGHLIGRKIADWKRSRYRTTWSVKTHERATGRKPKPYQRTLPSFVSIDDQLGGAHSYEPVDVAADRSTDLLRVLGAGDRGHAGHDVEGGAQEDERAA
jgi:hypothetical protein